MKKNSGTKGETRILEQTLDRLALSGEAPKGVFVLLLILYFASAITVSMSAGSQKVIMLGEIPLSVYTFAGIFSSISNLCIVLMVIFCGKLGFIASVTVLLIQCPMLLIGIIVKGNYTSLPGIFGNTLTIIAIIVIYSNKKKIEKYQLRLREQATTDILTGLPNGFAGTELINELVKRNKPFAAATIDINGFKNINDAFGFDMGNKVLVEIASRWRKIADEGLSGTTDFISRINGDEFSLVIRDHKSDEDIERTLKQYANAVEGKLNIDGYEFTVNASFGYAIFPSDTNDRDSLISFSVAAMKEIKRINSSEHILRFTPDLLQTQNTLVVDTIVREALENDLVYFNLQPQYDMSHKLRGFETLARMKDVDGNFISPVEFIPAAERAGLIDVLDSTIYKKAASFFGELIKKTGADITLSINASVKHLMKSGYVEEIRRLIEDYGIPGKQLEIEITESLMIESPEKAAACLNELKSMGISIAIDDFGTGYSSLGYLNSFQSDIIKIDKSFIDKMNTSESSQKYVEAIISLAHVLDFEVIAEGVEKPEQLETLRLSGCDYVQGYIWGRPLPMEEAERLVIGQ
ncbi:MAG: EAL domain-containing protein [Lachnospiraceae bacterium]|nr:EAL domain-containing protein [Lachnospiraceae bacterium]